MKEDDIVTLLSDKLSITPIIVPINEGDTLGHIDGYLSFIDDDTVAVIEYPKTDVFKHDNAHSNALNKYCQDLNQGRRIKPPFYHKKEDATKCGIFAKFLWSH